MTSDVEVLLRIGTTLLFGYGALLSVITEDGMIVQADMSLCIGTARYSASFRRISSRSTNLREYNMPKTTRPRIRVGEWVECWVSEFDPKQGRVQGMVKSVSRGPRPRFHLDFRGVDNPRVWSGPHLYTRVINTFYTSEIIRRLRTDEIVRLKLGQGFWLSREAR